VLLLLSEPADARRRAGLQWSLWRRRHQARARRDHVAQRAARQPLQRPPPDPPLPTALPGTAALSDSLWLQIAPLLPPQKPARGRPCLDHRRLLEGLLAIMRTGVPWREMPAAYGSWHTAYSRYQRWGQDGLWDRICAILHPTPTPGSPG